MLLKRILRSVTKPIAYKDDYIEILRRVNAGMLHHGNLTCFDYAIKNLPSANPILEIGTFCGLSANVMTYFKHIHNKKNILVCTDRWKNSQREDFIGASHITYNMCNKFVTENRNRNLMFFSSEDLPRVYEETSDDFFIKWKNGSESADVFNNTFKMGGPISFAYIDGNHSYEFVKRDFENCDNYLETGGFVLFDDSGDYSDWEVKKLVAELKGGNRYSVIMKNPNYLFQKR